MKNSFWAYFTIAAWAIFAASNKSVAGSVLLVCSGIWGLVEGIGELKENGRKNREV